MNETIYPVPVVEVMATVVEIFRYQQHQEIIELLENAHACFEAINYDNWNGGTYTWALRLEVPVSIYAAIEARLNVFENEIITKLNTFSRRYPNDPIGEVTITPITPGVSVLGQRMEPSDIEVHQLWPDDQFRLFLSHISKHKIEVSKLKYELGIRGVSAFVAHTDIEPTEEWRNKIELALRSMHALLALMTPEFHESLWTDQEIGWALGRNVLVVPVRLGVDPYGIVGKFQGLPGDINYPEALAVSIVKTLLAKTQTRIEMHRSLVNTFSKASSYKMAIETCRILVAIENFTDDEVVSIQKACVENSQVTTANGVVESIHRRFGKPKSTTKSKVSDDIPF